MKTSIQTAREAGQITHEELLRRFHYDPATGLLTRLVAAGNRGRHQAGVVVGWNSHGYRAVKIDKKSYLVHRLAFLYMTGNLPEADVDHINGVGSDNRWVNLRAVSHAVNMQNQRKPQKINKTGLLGVVFNKFAGRYEGAVTVNGKKTSKKFDTAQEAHDFYVNTKRELHEGCTL